MLAGIWGLLKSLPEILRLFKSLLAAIKKAEMERKINEGVEITTQIGKAKTDEERAKLAADLARHLSG